MKFLIVLSVLVAVAHGQLLQNVGTEIINATNLMISDLLLYEERIRDAISAGIGGVLSPLVQAPGPNVVGDLAENAIKRAVVNRNDKLAPLVEAPRKNVVGELVDNAIKRAVVNRDDKLAPLEQAPGKNVVGEIVDNAIKRDIAEKAAIDHQLEPVMF